MKKRRRKPWERPVLWGVLCLVPIAAALSIPSLYSTTDCGNETAAVATLRNIHTAQLHLKEMALIDGDGDGEGEYGVFTELTGDGRLRAGTGARDRPLLSGALRKPDASGRIARSGYWFRICLPGRPNLAETAWVCYAWPIEYGHSGERTFVVDQTGRVRWVDDPRYTGDDGPRPGAAFLDGGLDAVGGSPAAGFRTQDSNVWQEIEGPDCCWIGRSALPR